MSTVPSKALSLPWVTTAASRHRDGPAVANQLDLTPIAVDLMSLRDYTTLLGPGDRYFVIGIKPRS